MFDRALLSLPGIRRVLAVLAALALVKAGAIIGQAWLLASAISQLWLGAPFDTQLVPALGFLACFLARQIARYAQDTLLTRYANEQGAYLRKQLLEQALTGPVGWVPAHGTAAVTTSALDGIDQVRNYLRIILPKLLDAGIIIPATLIATFMLDWPSGVILLIVVPVIVFYMIMLGRMAQDRAARQYASYQVLSNHFIDTLRGLPTLKVFGAGKRHTRQVFKVSESFRRATVRTLRVATLSSVVLDLLATLGVAAVAMMLGFRLVDGSLGLFTGLAVLILAPEYFAPLREFAGDFHASLDGKNALADILALIDEQTREHPTSAANPPEPKGLFCWNENSHLKLTDLSFAYPSEDKEKLSPTVLDSAFFEATGFECVGVIGASGGGKSTLASIMGGFLTPSEGSLQIDGASLPLDTLQQEQWRSQILYIPQDPYIFHATLRENIAFYTPDASEDAIVRAMETVGLDDLARELPEGLDTMIGAGGRGLSGGQAQRIALARALLDTSRRILIFDEPTAHLDIETELELKQRMLPLMQNRLVIFATHRLHWLDNMDRVYRVESGKLQEITPEPATNPTVANNATPAKTNSSAVSTPKAASASTKSNHTPEINDASELSASPSDQWVRPYFTKYRKQLATALGLGIAATSFASLLMLTAGYLISGTAEATGSILFYYLPIAFVQLFGIGKPLLRYFERLQSHDWVFRMTSSLRVRLYKALERQAMQPARAAAGEVLGLVAEDIGHIQNLYLRSIFPLVIAWAVAVLAALGLGVFNLAFALAALAAFTIITVLIPLLAMRHTKPLARERKQQKDALYRDLTDDLLGASDWVFAGRGQECAECRQMQTQLAEQTENTLDLYSRNIQLISSALMGLLAFGMLWWASVHFGGQPGGQANWIAALVLGLFPLVETFSALGDAALQANTHTLAIRHLNDFPAVDDSLPQDDTLSAPKPTPVALEVEGMSFAYPDEKTVLDRITLNIPQGQKVAILGRSGSGKSTLAALVRGDLKPTNGRISLGGQAPWQQGDAIAASIGVVQQDAYLFNRRLRDNLTLGCPGASDDEIWKALESVKLDQVVRQLPRELDTMLGEAGMRFSGGERHRLALARVLLANTPIILLDEPTVGLDPETEQGVLDTLLQATQGKTLIMITHHLQGIAAFDRVIFLEDGHIELDGSPAQLATENPHYQQLLAFDH